MKDIKTNLLRFQQREQLQSEIKQAEEMLKHAKPDERGPIQTNINRTKRQLYSQSPEPLTAKEKDTLSALQKKLLKKITTNMPTGEVMRKNPAGAVDWHMKWEKVNKSLIRMWKNATIQLNPDSQDKDLVNLERYRPEGAVDRFRGDAQISGVMSYHNIPDENWPFDAPETTALAQVQRREVTAEDAESEVNKALDELDTTELDEEVVEKKETSPEQRAILIERLAKAREAKRKKAEEEQKLEDTIATEV